MTWLMIYLKKVLPSEGWGQVTREWVHGKEPQTLMASGLWGFGLYTELKKTLQIIFTLSNIVIMRNEARTVMMLQMHTCCIAAWSVSSFLSGVLTIMATVTLTMWDFRLGLYGLIFPGHKGPAHDWDIPSHHRSDRERWDAAWGHRGSWHWQEEDMFNCSCSNCVDDKTRYILARSTCFTAINEWQDRRSMTGLVMVSRDMKPCDRWQCDSQCCVMCDVWVYRTWNVINNLSLIKTFQSKDWSSENHAVISFLIRCSK